MRKKFRWWCSYTVHICKQKLFLFIRKFLFLFAGKFFFYLSGSFWLNWCEQRRKHRVWRILACEYILIKSFSEKNQNVLSLRIFKFSIWCLGPWSSNDQFEQGGNTAVHGGNIEVEPMSPNVHEQPPIWKWVKFSK